MVSGDTISRYQILGPLGKRGVGSVYEAEETRAQRNVILKVVPVPLRCGVDAEAVADEIRRAARTRHPNLYPVQDVENLGDQLLILLGPMDGEQLSRRIQRDPVEVGQAVQIGQLVAAGLQAAHTAGLVHGDLRTSNIFTTLKGQPAILDFGLAELTHAVAPPPYVSPEQARGGAPDERTDVWALGVVLFEMLAAALPFRRVHAADSPERFDDTVALSSIRPDVPPDLEAAIAKAISAKPEDRWGSIKEFVAELQPFRAVKGTTPKKIEVSPKKGKDTEVSETGESATPSIGQAVLGGVQKYWRLLAGFALFYLLFVNVISKIGKKDLQAAIAAGTGSKQTTGRKQLAVLPFEMAKAGGEAAVMMDGLRKVLSEEFGGAEKFKGVVSALKGDDIRNAADARHAGADLLLTGSANLKDDGIEFDMELVDAQTNEAVSKWAVKYNPNDPRSAANQMVDGVAKMMKVKSEELTGGGRAARDPMGDAYSSYVEGMGYLSHPEIGSNVDKAISAFRKATSQDQKFAHAWEGLGEGYVAKDKLEPDPALVDLGRQAGERAADLDPDMESAHALLGGIYDSTGRKDDAVRQYEKAVELEPGAADAAKELAKLYTNQGRTEDAEKTLKKTAAARKNDYYSYYVLGQFYAEIDRYGDAEAAFKRALEIAPDNDNVARELGALYMQLGRYEDASDALRKLTDKHPEAQNYALLSAAQFYSHHYGDAAISMEKATDLESGNYEYWGALGTYYRWVQGGEARSAPALRRAISLARKETHATTSDYPVHAAIAEYAARLGDAQTSASEAARLPRAAASGNALHLMIAYELTSNRKKAIELANPALRRPAILGQLKNHPDLASLWQDGAFQQALRR